MSPAARGTELKSRAALCSLLLFSLVACGTITSPVPHGENSDDPSQIPVPAPRANLCVSETQELTPEAITAYFAHWMRSDDEFGLHVCEDVTVFVALAPENHPADQAVKLLLSHGDDGREPSDVLVTMDRITQDVYATVIPNEDPRLESISFYEFMVESVDGSLSVLPLPARLVEALARQRLLDLQRFEMAALSEARRLDPDVFWTVDSASLDENAAWINEILASLSAELSLELLETDLSDIEELPSEFQAILVPIRDLFETYTRPLESDDLPALVIERLDAEARQLYCLWEVAQEASQFDRLQTFCHRVIHQGVDPMSDVVTHDMIIAMSLGEAFGGGSATMPSDSSVSAMEAPLFDSPPPSNRSASNPRRALTRSLSWHRRPSLNASVNRRVNQLLGRRG